MHEVPPVSERCILFGLALLGLCVAFYPDEPFGSFGIESAIRLFFSGIFLIAAATIFISLAVRFPKIRWTKKILPTTIYFLGKFNLNWPTLDLPRPTALITKEL